MIPSTNKLLVTEDWKKIYQSFQNADFKSYDFDTLRRTMISYLQVNYPEDFNDFIESSEYIALIDLIAYLGQNLSFRIDLNARENFLETAQRRDSILRLAQLISYSPKRNTPASGLLKITAVSTTDSVFDGNGVNLAGSSIVWNDPTNTNWYQQFISILNSTMEGRYAFGKPFDRATIDGMLAEQYKISSTNTDVPIYGFSKAIGGTTMNFEIVPATFSGASSIYEDTPQPGNQFSLIYKNDNQGTASANNGFFAQFKQGSLGVSSFTIDTPVPNEIVGVNKPSINATDVWLWQLDASGNYSTQWTKVSDLVGNNIIYNSLNNSQRDIFSVTSRDRDQIDLNFADGSFGNLPKGQFKLFYRQSNGLTYSIKPAQMSGIVISVPYTNKTGQSHTLTMTMGLQYTVTNSSGAESNASIQSKAPQAFYVQNRMVTAEDYNIAPLTLGNDILKVKSVNRVSSGVSKYFDLSDISGKYSKTNIFAADGFLYKDLHEEKFSFEFANRNEIFAAIKQQLVPVIASPALRSFYYDQYARPQLATNINSDPQTLPIYDMAWVQVNKTSGQSRGYFETLATINDTASPLTVGTYNLNNLRYVLPGAMIKFIPPAGKYFTAAGKIVSKSGATTVDYIWAKVIQVIGDGSNSGAGALGDGTGPIILSNLVDSAAIPAEIIPKFNDVFVYAFENELVNLCLNQRNFGLTLNNKTRTWDIIADSNLDLFSDFSLANQSNIFNASKDASWLVAFVWNNTGYTVRYRIVDYIFESEQETAFFIDSNTVNYDFTTNTVIKDQISVLSINSANTSASVSLGKDYRWQIDGAVTAADGYVDPKKVKVSFYDYNNLGQIDDPDAFDMIVQPMTTDAQTGFNDKFVYLQRDMATNGYSLADKALFQTAPTPDAVVGTPADGDLFYFYDPAYNVVNRYSNNLWVYEPGYIAYSGRDSLKFHYVHNSGEDRRIDPSKSNIVDIYLLTASYDTEYRTWLASGIGAAPLAPTSQSLEQNFAGALDAIKTISDEIVFMPVKYKTLFGSKADVNLQATFKAVKNPTRPISDNELKAGILTAIQTFFSLENWDFGQSFHFSELSTYVMTAMTPDITNFIIVPKATNNFGSLYEIACQSNEIFINGALSSDIEIIDAITASQLKTSSIVTTSGN